MFELLRRTGRLVALEMSIRKYPLEKTCNTNGPFNHSATEIK